MHIRVRVGGSEDGEVEELGRPNAQSIGHEQEAGDRRDDVSVLDARQERPAQRTSGGSLWKAGRHAMVADPGTEGDRERRSGPVLRMFSNS